MQTQPFRPNMALALVAFAIVFGLMFAGARAIQADQAGFWSISGQGLPLPTQAAVAPGAAPGQAVPQPEGPWPSPTPDPPHALPPIRTEAEQYWVMPGDTLGEIAKKHGVSLDQIIQENSLVNPNLLEVGQLLNIPIPLPGEASPQFKIVPDSGLVYGPDSVGFHVVEFIQRQPGYLAGYQEELEERSVSGAKIVERIAQEYSVDPRLLLAVLEYQSGWVTNRDPKKGTLDFPIGVNDARRRGLYRQLAYAANQLNRGYYLWRANGAATWLLGDGSVLPISPVINAGTAAVQHFFAGLYDRSAWETAVSPTGLYSTYNALFGYPFQNPADPLLPAGLAQPPMQLPFEPGEKWAFTGGPHGGWADGSGWAALDFAPPGEALGCVQSNAWVVAVADGLILRTGNGAVIQDLDGDGYEQTGWTVFYMHIENRGRVEPGTYVKAGERIGHPSCEGGVSTGTHVHIARRYNGEWIPADRDMPFVLDGWVSSGDGFEYNGSLKRDGTVIEAYAGRSPGNGIAR